MRKMVNRTSNPITSTMVVPSEALAAVIGPEPCSRMQVTKKLWAYIKDHELQNGRMIKTDAKLKPIMDGVDEINMFAMMGLVNRHLTVASQ